MRIIPLLTIAIAIAGLADGAKAAPAAAFVRASGVDGSASIDRVQYRDYYDDDDFYGDRRERRQRRDRHRYDDGGFERRDFGNRRSERRDRDRSERSDDRRPARQRPHRNNDGAVDLRDPRWARTCKLLPDSPVCSQLRRGR